jgi:hypothetical protein
MAGRKTSTFVVDEAITRIVCTVDCRKISVWPQDGSSDYFERAPDSNSTQVKHFAGEALHFEFGLYKAGDTVGWAQTVSGAGSKTFHMVEQQ